VILCVDIGNTSIKLARVDGRRIVAMARISSVASSRQMTRAVKRLSVRGITHAAIASVRPASTGAMHRAVQHVLDCPVLVVTHRARLPIAIATRRPARVGVDRICAACGALSGRARSAIVVDAGSAITIDLVLDRVLRGGLIIPGPGMMLSALHQFTAQLPDLRVEHAGGRFDDTAPAMQTGVEVGAAGAILEAVHFLERRARRRPAVWLTGGHAGLVSPHLPTAWRRSPHLTLLGLADIARVGLRGS
jgi:type III pantothenate kinase